MSKAINCTSCGASNHLPEGKNSMFCAFCGNSIQSETKTSNNESKIKFKPELEKFFRNHNNFHSTQRRVDGGIEYWYLNTWIFSPDTYHYSLKLINRGVKTLDEIIIWYSDNKLEKIESLDLKNNEITSLKGINRFKLGTLDISNNSLEYVDELPSLFEDEFDFNFSGNKSLKGFTDAAINKMNNYRLKSSSTLRLKDVPNFNFSILQKINFKKIIENDDMSNMTYISIVIDNNDKSNHIISELNKSGFEVLFKNNNEINLRIKSEYWKKIDNSVDYGDLSEKIIKYVILTLFALLIIFIVKECSSISSSNNDDNIENSSTIVDSSYKAPEEASAITYQEAYVDTLANQNDTSSADYNSYNENQNSIVYDSEINYFLGKWEDENSFITFNVGGKCTLKLKSNGYTVDYYWKYENGILYVGSDINDLLPHSIYDKDSDSFTFKADNDNTIYHARRF